MAITIQGQSKRIGLALSGGGFRAAAFHLGVFRKLQEMKLLDCVDLLSCVSGGSIAGGYLASHWSDPKKLDGLEAYLRTRSVAVAAFVRGAFDPFHGRLDVLAQTYERDLFGAKTLDDLAGGPRTYLNATNLATGNMFSFVGGGGKASEMGDYELGFVPAGAFPLSRAVAASSAFPPVFPPLKLSRTVYPTKLDVDYVTLTDGGVYDNMGVNPVVRDRNALDYVIISDGGKPFSIDERPTDSGALVLKAAIDILMEQVRGLEFDRVQHRNLANVGPKPLWFSIDSAKGEALPGDHEAASSVRTNLAKLSDREMTVLLRHGGALVLARLQKYAPEVLAAVS